MADNIITAIPPLADIPTTQHLLGDTGRTSIFGLIKSGHLEAVKIGRCTKITGESIRRLIDTAPRR